MNEEREDRPNPEELLEIIKREELQQKKGKLKIFLGMAAGVGKTYSMLENAQWLKKEGIDVVVGVVNTHGREDTARILEGLEIIPEKTIQYKDATFKEMDLDAILKCKPDVVIVDELAHSNVPGSRHPKRWQDVIEILDNGIDVNTTLNVQHIESLKDVVEKITGITIRETVPDIVIETAAYIELIDLIPNELLKRLKEGKVYLGDQSIIAAKNFFQEDRLTALREIVLRFAAEKVDHDLKGMFSSAERSDAWKTRERLLVAVSHSPHSQKLIRITRRLAFNLDAPWIALHIDTGNVLDQDEKETLSKNLALARDLGAEVITTSSSNISEAIQRVARQKSVTQIIIGRPPKRWLIDFFQRNTLMDSLARDCSDIDLHVIRQTLFSKQFGKKWKFFRASKNIYSYFAVFAFVLLFTAFNWFIIPSLGYKVAGFLNLLGILFLSLFFSKGPIFFASILYALIWIFLFIPETKSLFSMDEDIVLLAFYFLTAIFTAILTDNARRDKEMLAKREKSLEALYEIVRSIASASSAEEALLAVKDRLNSILEGKYEIFIKHIDKGLVIDASSSISNNEKEKAAIAWVFQNGQEAGWSTSTLPYAQSLYIPLKGHHEVVGVLAYQPKKEKEITLEEKNLLYSVGQQLANYLERNISEERARQHEHHRQIEKIYQSILNLIANLFEGPLLTIQDSIKELKAQEVPSQPEKTLNPLERIGGSAESLTRIIDNISAMVNLSAGFTPINREKYDIKNLINLCCEKLMKSSSVYTWKVVIEDNLPEITFDYDLIELLFYNLAFHAMEFSPPESVIEIEAKRNGDYVVMSVAGEGQSIPPEMLEVAFEKFYRLPGSTSTGLGLGLAIAKAIAEIHSGRLSVQNRPNGGMVFSLYLPIF